MPDGESKSKRSRNPDIRPEIEWRGAFTSSEANRLHAEAFETRLFSDAEWDWHSVVEKHSLGWVTARVDKRFVGFVNVVSDGLVHGWIQDVMVASDVRGSGIGTMLVKAAGDGARAAGCEWLHVDFADDLEKFYFDACGFIPTKAGLIQL
ncbi:MAG: GNAT family N-acetyltransferase [Acidimicrobiales bacterium]